MLRSTRDRRALCSQHQICRLYFQINHCGEETGNERRAYYRRLHIYHISIPVTSQQTELNAASVAMRIIVVMCAEGTRH